MLPSRVSDLPPFRYLAKTTTKQKVFRSAKEAMSFKYKEGWWGCQISLLPPIYVGDYVNHYGDGDEKFKVTAIEQTAEDEYKLQVAEDCPFRIQDAFTDFVNPWGFYDFTAKFDKEVAEAFYNRVPTNQRVHVITVTHGVFEDRYGEILSKTQQSPYSASFGLRQRNKEKAGFIYLWLKPHFDSWSQIATRVVDIQPERNSND